MRAIRKMSKSTDKTAACAIDMKRYYDIKTRVTAMTLACMMAFTTMPATSFASDITDGEMAISENDASESQTLEPAYESDVLPDPAPDNVTPALNDGVDENEGDIIPDEDPVSPDADPGQETTGMDLSSDLLIEEDAKP